MLFNIKNLRINSFCRNVVSKVIRCNRVIDSEYDSVNNIQLIFDVVYEKE